jgi:hypothetical protein
VPESIIERNSLRRQKQENAAREIVIRIWIVTLAILAIPALGAVIVGLGQCKQSECPAAPSQTARYLSR